MTRLFAVALVLLAITPSAQAQTPAAPADSTAPVAERGGALDLDALPVRSVRGVAAWAPGVRADLATGRLTVRARSVLGSAEPRFLVDGVRQLDDGALPFEAVRRVRVLTEGVPARYGEAAGGLVFVETDAPTEAVGGRIEGYTSRATDAFGADLGALALRGPLGTWGGAWVAAELGRQADASPYGVAPYQLTDDAYAALQAAPQSLRVEEGGTARFVPFPVEAAQAAVDAGAPLSPDDLRRVLGLGPDATVDPYPISTAETFGEDAFERRAAKADPLDDLRLAAGLTLRPLSGMTLRATGGLGRQRAEGTASPAELYERLPFNRGALYDAEASGARAALALEHAVTPAVRYRLAASAERETAVSRPLGFSDRVEDAIGYGDVDGEAGAVARRYFVFRDVGQGQAYQPWFAQDAGVRPGRLSGLTFSLPGAPVSRYERSAASLVRVEGAVEVTRGAHRLHVGASLEQETHRRFVLDGYQLAGYVADANGPEQSLSGFPAGLTDYADLPFNALRHRGWGYGYSYNGLEETDAEDPAAYFPDATGRRQNTDLAPFRPRTLAGYVEDVVTLGPLSLRAGVRVEVYDANATVPLDLYAPTPIVRARDLPSVPDGVEPDFAVYYNGNQVVGYRDLDGRFYDDQGIAAARERILTERRGQVRSSEAPRAEAFRDAPVHVSVEPRLGVALRASDRVRLLASYDRLSRRPDPSFYAPFADYEELGGASTVGNGALRPETVDALRLGGEWTVPSLRVATVAFARRARGVPVAWQLGGGFPSYATVDNQGRVDEVGIDLDVIWTPSRGVTVRGGYTLAAAESNRSDPDDIGFSYLALADPDQEAFLHPAANDTRHAVDLELAARVPGDLGPRVAGVPVLGGLGGGLVLSAQSGLPYTATEGFAFTVRDLFVPEIEGSVNGARLPWTHQVDLRLDKQIPVAGSTLEAFVWIENLLDTDNVLAVYRVSGQPDTDRFPESVNGQTQLSTPERAFAYRAFTTGAVNVGGRQSTPGAYFYGRPRQVRLGLRATF